MLKIRNAVKEDVPRIMEIYCYAQEFMIKCGNPTQWGHSYPTRELIDCDILNQACKVVYDETGIHGVVALYEGIDPTYVHIEEGSWLNNDPYITIHRIASDGRVHGVFKTVADYCKNMIDNVKLDTHANNLIMQSLIAKNDSPDAGLFMLMMVLLELHISGRKSDELPS